MTDQESEVAALASALDNEYAVVFGLGVAGGRLEEELRARVHDAENAHRARIRTWRGLVRDRDAEPPSATSWYEMPWPVPDAEAAVELLVFLEEGATRSARSVVEAGAEDTGHDLRLSGAAAMSDSAVRAAGWRLERDGVMPATGASVAWPGA